MDEAKEKLSQEEIRLRRVTRRLQPLFRDAATHAGHFRTCRLSKCRRAKRCVGCHPADEIGTTHYKQFPPCVVDDATQTAVNHATEELFDLERQEFLARGYSPEQLDRWSEADSRAMEESDDWPDDPLCPLSRASPRGR